MTHTPHKMTITSLLLMIAGCSNPSDTEMIGQWRMDCANHPAMTQQQIADIANVNTLTLTIDADSFFFRSVQGTTSLSNWRYGYKVLNTEANTYSLEAAIKGKLVNNITVDIIDSNQLVFGDAWYNDQLIPPHFKACRFIRSN
jgi:hypothetical protein